MKINLKITVLAFTLMINTVKAEEVFPGPAFTPEEELALDNSPLRREALWTSLIEKARLKGIAARESAKKSLPSNATSWDKEQARRQGFNVYETEMQKSIHYLDTRWDVDGVYNLKDLLFKDRYFESLKRIAYEQSQVQALATLF